MRSTIAHGRIRYQQAITFSARSSTARPNLYSWIISTSYYGGIGTFVGLGPTLLSDVTDGCGPGTAHQLASVTTAICLESSRQS